MGSPLGRPPGPIGWPLLGVLFDFRKNPAEYLSYVVREFGDIAYFRVALRKVYLLNRPDLIEEVLVTHPNNFVDATLPGLAPREAATQPRGTWSAGETVNLDEALPDQAWIWRLLAANPEAESRMRAEIAAVCGTRTPTEGDFFHLDYTGGVVLEALRLYPPVWIVARRNRAMMRLFNYHVSGNSVCLMSPYLMQRNPRFWPDPERFDPDRFLRDAVAARPRFAYFPFGGLLTAESAQTALVTRTLELACTAQKWRFRPASEQPVALDPRRPLRPLGGLHMIAAPA